MGDNEIQLSDTSVVPWELEKAWNTLVKNRTVAQHLLRPQIARSWERCLTYDVDPFELCRVEKNDSFNFILEKNRLLLDVSNDYLHNLETILRGHEFIVVLIDPEGYIVDAVGDDKAMHKAETARFCTGTKSTEDVLGTTAPGICLSQRIPIQVFGHEHYCQVFHGWCCSSAPIFNIKRELAGVINVASIDCQRHSPQVLSLIQLTAKSIGTDIDHRLVRDEFYRTKYRMASIVDNSPQAMLIFDGDNNLSHFNNSALKLLQARTNDLIGRNASDLIVNKCQPGEGEADDDNWGEMHFLITSREMKLGARVVRLSDTEIEPLGTMVLLRDPAGSVDGMPCLPLRFSFQDFIHRCQSMAEIIREAKFMARMEHGILLEGESGTGKEVLAQAIHNESLRRQNPFVAINCAALPRELIQSELFGYESGAFTGANRAGQAGKFEQAHGGTIFLDEIGDMPLEAQANLLRVLQEKALVRIGGCRTRQVDVRVIAATNKNPMELVREGKFREDLYYRLSVINLHIPPLRERKDDLWLLIEHFMNKHATDEVRFATVEFSPEAKRLMEAYDWPGNIRELENAVIVAMARTRDGVITPRELPPAVANCRSLSGSGTAGSLDEVEGRAIAQALAASNGQISKAAKILGISRATLYRKIKKLELEGWWPGP